MKKINAVLMVCLFAVVGHSNAYAAETTKLQAINAQLTSALEQYALDSSACSNFDFKSIGEQVNAAIDAGISAGTSTAAFEATEAGKGFELLEEHCSSNS